MTLRRRPELSLLLAAMALSRFAFRSHYLYDLDSVNFALGMKQFDPRVHQPHPPGYYLYICLGRLLNFFVHDPNLALILLSIAAGCGTIFFIYQMALEWFGLSAARFASLLFLFSPLAWFHGAVALTYGVEAFFSALLGYLCWRISRGDSGLIWLAGLSLGISAGVRPSSLLFLGPLFVFALWHRSTKDRWLGGMVLLLALAAWAIPMVWSSGGLSSYFGALFSLWHNVPSRATVFNSSPATTLARIFTIVWIYVLAFGTASFALPPRPGRATPVDPRRKLFTAVWIVPALCFFAFIYLKFVNSGYLLLLMPPACLWLGLWLSEWHRNSGLPRPLRAAAVWMGATANVLIFLFSPIYCSYRSIRQFEAEIAGIERALPQAAPPANTLIVAFDSHFLGFRHAGYYLPGYLTLEYPAARMPEGKRIFAMQGRETRLLAGPLASPRARFVLFPLPDGNDYRQYMDKVIKQLPAQDLQTLREGKYEFVTGPSSDLPLLFPQLGVSQQSVYMPLHSGAQAVNIRAH